MTVSTLGNAQAVTRLRTTGDCKLVIRTRDIVNVLPINSSQCYFLYTNIHKCQCTWSALSDLKLEAIAECFLI